MNVNIIIDQSKALPDFENVLLINENLSAIPDSACNNIRLDNVIDFMSDKQMGTLLQKIRHNGSIDIKSTDAMTIISQMHIGSIEFDKGSPLLSSGRLRLTSAPFVKDSLEKQGFIVEFAGVGKTEYQVIAKRP